MPNNTPHETSRTPIDITIDALIRAHADACRVGDDEMRRILANKINRCCTFANGEKHA